jgi:NADPH-dependent glutamate synthase beta subunit-like oxidoreductase
MISDANIKVNRDSCYACGTCVERCITDNLRLSIGPCRTACPIHMNCQGYIRLLAQGKEREAAEEMRSGSPFGAILGRICTHPCEKSCERAKVDSAVSIRAIKRYLTDAFPEITYRPSAPVPETGFSAAVIGSGPAGLMAAYELRSRGHRVTVYEAESEPGGLLRYGIPAFRLPGEIVDQSIALLSEMGAIFKTSQTFGKTLDPQALISQHGAVIVSTGAGSSAVLEIPGADLPNIMDAFELLKRVKAGCQIRLGRSVTVIGGGNTAVDAALSCRLLGVEKVSLVALEDAANMPAFEPEIREAVEAGVQIENCWGPTAFIPDEDGSIEIEFARCLAVFDEKGAFAPNLENTCGLRLKSDTIVLAVGQHPGKEEWLQLFSDPQTGKISIDPLTRQSLNAGSLFVCGDAETGPGSVVNAMASAREAALSADRFMRNAGLKWGRNYWAGGYVKEFEADIARAVSRDRVEINKLPPTERTIDREIEQTYSAAEALREAERCLSCGRAFEMNKTCWYCLPCEIECPVNALEVRMPYLVR